MAHTQLMNTLVGSWPWRAMAQLLLDLQSKLNNEKLDINSSDSFIEQECNKRLDSTTLTEKDNEVDMMTESVIKWDTNTKKYGIGLL